MKLVATTHRPVTASSAHLARSAWAARVSLSLVLAAPACATTTSRTIPREVESRLELGPERSRIVILQAPEHPEVVTVLHEARCPVRRVSVQHTEIEQSTNTTTLTDALGFGVGGVLIVGALTSNESGRWRILNSDQPRTHVVLTLGIAVLAFPLLVGGTETIPGPDIETVDPTRWDLCASAPAVGVQLLAPGGERVTTDALGSARFSSPVNAEELRVGGAPPGEVRRGAGRPPGASVPSRALPPGSADAPGPAPPSASEAPPKPAP